MGTVSRHYASSVECCVAERPMLGEGVSGDAFVCKPFDGGTLVCAIDGLGHGEEANEASELAKQVMEQHASEPLIPLVERCDAEIRHTRGAVASLARFDYTTDTMSWLGVGNVDGVLFCKDKDGGTDRQSMIVRGGVVGYKLPPLKVSTFDIHVGDTLVLATDGLAGAFVDHIDHQAELASIAESLLAEYGKLNDDALVIAARYLGGDAG